MPKDKKKIKRMNCAFKKDGAVGFVYDGEILDEPFMGIVRNTLSELADIWFHYVLDCQDTEEKAKSFEVIIKI